MKVKIHSLFQYLLETTNVVPEAIVGFSLSSSPHLKDFIADLDPELSLDWNQASFRGLPALRDRVLAQAGLAGICAADDVLITAGTAEANYLAIRQLLQAGDHMVTETPGWPQAAVLGKAIGAEISVVKRDEGNGWRLPIDALEDVVNDRTKLIFLSNPNNPTGQLMTADEIAQVIAIADRVGAWVIVDEVYAGLEWAGPRAPSIAGLYRRGITTGSVSKALGLQGLRTGWMICQDADLIMDALILRENSSEIMNILGEVIAEVALRPERLLPALTVARAEALTNLEKLDRFVKDTDLDWIRPEAGLIGLARLPEGIGSDDFAHRLLGPPYRTFLLPGSAYDLPNHIRLGVGGGKKVDLDKGLQRVALLLENWEFPH